LQIAPDVAPSGPASQGREATRKENRPNILTGRRHFSILMRFSYIIYGKRAGIPNRHVRFYGFYATAAASGNAKNVPQ